jgi:hypothetical protein
MAEELGLHDWLARVSKAGTRKEIFAVLDQFRKSSWTDEECAQMSKHYIRMIELVKPDPSDSDTAGDASQVQEGADGPVWYEKM